MANGYMGKILWVDLSKNKIWEESANGDLPQVSELRLGCLPAFTRMKAGADPLGSDNILGLLQGRDSTILGGSGMPWWANRRWEAGAMQFWRLFDRTEIRRL